MVCLKQLSFTTAVVLSITETAFALPINNNGNDAALARRQAYPEERDLEARKFHKNLFDNTFKFLNVGNAIASVAMPSSRDVEERDSEDALEERDSEDALEERDFEDYLEERDFEDYLEERDFEDALEERDFEESEVMTRGFGGALKGPNAGAHIGSGLDAAYTIASTYGTIKNVAKAVMGGGEGKRAVEELDPRTLDDLVRRAFEDAVDELYY